MLETKQNRQRGAVSFLTVIFLALLLTTMTVSFVRQSVNEQRQAADDDLTNRAFYAAESGVEDAKRAIEMLQNNTMTPAQLNGADCDTPTVGNFDSVLSTAAGVDAAYTCQLIDMTAPNIQDQLDLWEGITIPLVGVDNSWTSIEIKWHRIGADNGTTSRSGNSSSLPPIGSWRSGSQVWPAMLRASVFDTPTGNSFTRGDIVGRSAGFLNPLSGPVPTVTIGNLEERIVNAGCANTGVFACTVNISNFSPGSRDYYLRLQAIYQPTSIQVTLRRGAASVDLSGVQAVVDVTGRAGDVYRRVEARVSLIGNDYPFPDYALMSATDICKNFAVTDDPSEFSSVNAATVTSSCTD